MKKDSKCVDAYVDVGGYEVYKGTHCWSELTNVDGSDGGFIYIGMEYGPEDNPTRFQFSLLEDHYAPGSTLNLKEKIKLESQLNLIKTESTIYAQILQSFKDNGVRFIFKIDKETCEEHGANAFFEGGSNSIGFKGVEEIKVENILEELIHAAQYQIYGSLFQFICNY